MTPLSPMHTPPHPGEVLKELWLDELKLSITETAKALDVSRVAISEIVNKRRGISPNMALRLSKAFQTSPNMWLNMQLAYDLWHEEQESHHFLKSVQPLSGSSSSDHGKRPQ